jgi:hypothetical protein
MSKFPISGKEIPEIDLREITVKEWREMFKPSQPELEGDMTLGKASGLSVEDVQALALYDYRALFQAVLEKSRKPLEDPKA